MHDLIATMVLDQLNWFQMQITDQTVFKTTENLKLTVGDVYLNLGLKIQPFSQAKQNWSNNYQGGFWKTTYL